MAMSDKQQLIHQIRRYIRDSSLNLFDEPEEVTEKDILLYPVSDNDRRPDLIIITASRQDNPIYTSDSKWIAFLVATSIYIIHRDQCIVLLTDTDCIKFKKMNKVRAIGFEESRVYKAHKETLRLLANSARLTELTPETITLKRRRDDEDIDDLSGADSVVEIITLSRHNEDDNTSLVIETRVCVECEKELPLSKFIVKSKSKKKNDTQQKEYTSYRKKCGSCRWVGYKKVKVSK